MSDYIRWLRAQVGSQRIFLAFASVVLRDAQGRILLQLRNDFGSWGLPGGALELGEDILTCARRELLEETGLQAGDLTLVGLYSGPRYEVTYPNGDQVQQFTFCFQGQVQGGEMRVDGVENWAQRFFHPTEVPWQALPCWYHDMLQAALQPGEPFFEPPESREQTRPQWEVLRPLIGTARYIGVGGTAVTVREDGRLLVMQRGDDGQWGFPGGYSHLGENAAQTAVRETHEETSLQVEPERLLGIYTHPEPWVYPHGDEVQFAAAIFRARLTGGALRADGSETRRAAWVTPQELAALPAGKIYQRLHAQVLAHLEAGHFVI
ncbi:MAG: NUDIX domain-containing protein [Anaerolineales bacterium]|nr:NUDIX domain-containing protein [Anaerolineales bacterium]